MMKAVLSIICMMAGAFVPMLAWIDYKKLFKR